MRPSEIVYEGVPVFAVDHIASDLPTVTWSIAWGETPINLNPTRWQRFTRRCKVYGQRASGAFSVLIGRKIAVGEDEFYDGGY